GPQHLQEVQFGQRAGAGDEVGGDGRPLAPAGEVAGGLDGVAAGLAQFHKTPLVTPLAQKMPGSTVAETAPADGRVGCGGRKEAGEGGGKGGGKCPAAGRRRPLAFPGPAGRNRSGQVSPAVCPPVYGCGGPTPRSLPDKPLIDPDAPLRQGVNDPLWRGVQ